MKRLFVVLLAAVISVPIAARAQTQAPTGLWDAAVVVNGLEIPFRFEIAGNGSQVSGWFFNGDEKVASTGGKFENGVVTLNFDHYATAVEATSSARCTSRGATISLSAGKRGRKRSSASKRHASSAA